MRPLETLFILSIAVASLWFRGDLAADVKKWASRIALVIILLQAIFEGWRWQLIPADIAFLVIALPILARTWKKGSLDFSTEQKTLPAKQSFVLLCVSAALLVVTPISQLPEPTGKYKIGKINYKFIDNARAEPFSSDKSARREIKLQIWYPAMLNGKASKAPFMTPFNNIQPYIDSPVFTTLASHLHLIKTHAMSDASVENTRARFPVLLFSHGLLGGAIQNTVLAEELASHGFIVVGIDHAYDAAFTIFPDKTICSQLISKKQDGVPDVASKEGIAARVKDAESVLNQLPVLNQNDPILKEHFDLDEVGIYGHSFGGQTAMLACAEDKRFKAGLSMDGFSPLPPNSSIEQPFMFIQGDRPGDPLGIDRFCSVVNPNRYDLKLAGAEHANFTDLPVVTPLHWVLGISGKIAPRRATECINSYVVAFFSHYLANESTRLLEGDSWALSEMKFYVPPTK